MDATYALLLESDGEPDTLGSRLDEPMPHELSREEARRLELRKDARQNRAAISLLGGLALAK